MDVDLIRTRVTLARMQGDQERLHAQLEATGLTDFAERADWFMDHWTPDEQLAWRRHWKALGLHDPEPRQPRFVRGSLAVVVKRKHRKKPPPVIPRDRQLEIALAVLAAQDAAPAAGRKAA